MKEKRVYSVRPEPCDSKIEAVREALSSWFRGNERDLPWRRTRDPFRVLVSEVMLQQIQVKRSVPFYLASWSGYRRYACSQTHRSPTPSESGATWGGTSGW